MMSLVSGLSLNFCSEWTEKLKFWLSGKRPSGHRTVRSRQAGQETTSLTHVAVDSVIVGIAHAFGPAVGSHGKQAVLGAFQEARHATLGHVEVDALALVALGPMVHFVSEGTVEIANPLAFDRVVRVAVDSS